MTIRNRLAAAGLAMAVALGNAVPGFAADKLVITMDTPPGHVRTRMIRDFVALMEDRSGGSMEFEVFDSNTLYSARDSMKAVARGDAGMTILITPYLSRVVSDFNVFDLPVLNGMTEDERVAMLDGGLGDALAKQAEDKLGVVVPGKFWSMGKVYLWSTAKPMNAFADLKDMQIRIPGGAALVMRMNAIGASAVSMPGSDVPLALQQGTVDATMSGPDYVYNNKFWDAGVQHGFWDGGIVGFLLPMVNADYWNSLTDEEKTLFRETWDEVTAVERETVKNEEMDFVAKLAEHGVTTVAATDDDVAQANAAMMAIQPEMIEKLEISPEIVELATSFAK